MRISIIAGAVSSRGYFRGKLLFRLNRSNPCSTYRYGFANCRRRSRIVWIAREIIRLRSRWLYITLPISAREECDAPRCINDFSSFLIRTFSRMTFFSPPGRYRNSLLPVFAFLMKMSSLVARFGSRCCWRDILLKKKRKKLSGKFANSSLHHQIDCARI